MAEEKKKERIRDWYRRTTGRSIRILFWITGVALIGMVAAHFLMPYEMLHKTQIFNGALTLPILGGIWIFFFIYGFLMPSREASFRAQETLEDGVTIIDRLIKERLEPAAQVWQRIGEKLEKAMNEGLLTEVKSVIEELKQAAKKVEEGNGEIKALSADVKPMVQKLREVQERLEEKNFLTDLHEGVKALRDLGRPIGPIHSTTPDDIDKPKVGKALAMIKKAEVKPKAGGSSS